MTTCTSFIEPLNLQCLFVNTFAGSADIFLFVSFIFIAAIAAFFRMSGLTMGIAMVLYVTIMVGFLQLQWALLIIGLIGGIIVFFTIAKIVK